MPFTHSVSVRPESEALLTKLVDWQIREVPREKWTLLGPIERPELVRRVFASGDAGGSTKTFEGVPAVAAFDVILEEDPKRLLPGEPTTNIYHYAFERDENGRLVQWCGSKDETILDHWPVGKSTQTVIKHYSRLSEGLL